MGCKSEAFLAGYQPKTIPINTETPKAKPIEETVIVKGRFITLDRIKEMT